MSAVDIVVGRQAIFDRELSVIGYELLFRTCDGDHRVMADLDGDLMTSEVLYSSVSIGIDRLVGGKLAFCNGDRGLLTGAVPVTLPPEQTVVEVLESVEIDDEVLAGCRDLVNRGFRLALDDFLWFDGAERLLELAWIVKIDLLLVPASELPDLVTRCRAYDVRLLAEKIETADELQMCMDLGFDYFQGYILQRPRVVPGRTLETSHQGRVRLAAHMLSADIDFDEIERIVRTEPGMALQILRLASVGGRDGTLGEIRSLRQAIVMVGERRIQNWVALLMLARPGVTSVEDFAAALTRARMCELLAARMHPGSASMAYTAGMLSAFDLLLGVPAKDVLPALAIGDSLRAAAFDRVGPIGRLVEDVVQFQGIHEVTPELAVRYGAWIQVASIRALTWAVEASRGWEHAADAEPQAG